MTDVKKQLAKWIDDDRDKIIGFLCDFVRAKSPNPPGDTTLAAAHVTRFPRSERPALSRDRASGDHAERGGLVRHGQAWPSPRAERAHGRVPGRRPGRGMDPGSMGRGDRERQDLRTRGGRHEGGHVGVDLHLLLPPSGARAPEGQADAHRGLRRGDLRPVGCALFDGASSGSPWRLLPERRAEQSSHHPLRREGSVLGQVHPAHEGRPRRLHASLAQRHEAGGATDRRSRGADEPRAVGAHRHRRCAGGRRRGHRRGAGPGREGHRPARHPEHRGHSRWRQSEYRARHVLVRGRHPPSPGLGRRRSSPRSARS